MLRRSSNVFKSALMPMWTAYGLHQLYIPAFFQKQACTPFPPTPADIIHAAVRGGVKLQHVQNAAVSIPAGGAFVAGIPKTGAWQFAALDSSLAQVVFPVPLVPVRIGCESRSCST
jgi:hypothetical protein